MLSKQVVKGLGWQLVMPDPELLSGKSVADVLAALVDLVKAEEIIVRDIEGGGASLSQIRSREDEEGGCDPETLLRLVRAMNQIDWGDFFLLSKMQSEDFSKCTSIQMAIHLSEVTLRCVDSGYFYFYGTSHKYFESLHSIFPITERKVSSIDDLDYPY